MKVLVVGGAGFIGSHVSPFFHDLGHTVTVMSRSRPKGLSRLNELAFVRPTTSRTTAATAGWKVTIG